MTEIVFLIEDDPDGGCTARALGAAIFTQANDTATLREQIRDAVRCHFADKQSRFKLIRLQTRKSHDTNFFTVLGKMLIKGYARGVSLLTKQGNQIWLFHFGVSCHAPLFRHAFQFLGCESLQNSRIFDDIW